MQKNFSIYSGTSSYADSPYLHEDIDCKGLLIFLNQESGSGSVTSTLKYQDGFKNDFPITSVTTTSASMQAVIEIYPNTLGSFGSIPSSIISGIVPTQWHVDSVVSGDATYQVSASMLEVK